ncbi:hypothetical protein DFAR_3930004 [Desulfarculales bacterium]
MPARIISGQEARELESQMETVAALHLPSSGIHHRCRCPGSQALRSGQQRRGHLPALDPPGRGGLPPLGPGAILAG